MDELVFPIFSRPKVTKEQAYQAGHDCAINGANTNNCNFSIFTSKENTKEWERGNFDAIARFKKENKA